jgi:hypothetical protein
MQEDSTTGQRDEPVLPPLLLRNTCDHPSLWVVPSPGTREALVPAAPGGVAGPRRDRRRVDAPRPPALPRRGLTAGAHAT